MTFTLTREQLEAKRAELAQDGVTLTGDSGQFTAKGVTLSFNYTEPTLDIEVLHKPMLDPEFVIEDYISGFFKTS